LRRYQALAAAPSRRSAIQTGLLVTAAAALALAWYTSPEKVAGYLVDRMPHLFLTDGPAQIQQITPPPSATLELARSAPAVEITPSHPASVSVAEREPPLTAAKVAPASVEEAAEAIEPALRDQGH
jgi:hypothetical protein